jgi:diaminopimelate decarboxylase
VVGLHIFGGSQILGAQALIDAQALTVELGLRLAAALRGGIEWLNIGGGFGIPYFPNERPLELAPVAGNLHRLAARAREAAGVPLVLELGRYLVAEEGVYVCRVLDRKVSQDQTFVVTDGGLHHHLAASGNFGQVLRKNYPVAVGNRLDAGRREVQTVVGPLCTPLDLLADRMEMAHAEVGDLIVVFRSGAYGPTASPTRFLSHPPPAEVLA